MTTALLCAVTWFGLSRPAPALANINVQFDENDIMQRSEWVMFVRADRLPNYLNYPGSQLRPLTQVRITSWKGLGGSSSGNKAYEDLWYHDGVPVGSRRYQLLSVRPRAVGTIFVQSSPDAQIESRALTNAILRLTVDLNNRQLDPASVIVPQEICPQIVADLGFFGFRQRSAGQFSIRPQASIHLISNPTAYDEFLYFER